FGCTSSATVTGDKLAISEMSGALAMQGRALAMEGSALAMRGGALAMDGAALSINGVSMHRCVVRPVGGAHKLAEVEVVVVCNLTPAFASFELAHDRVEALARCVGQQVCMFQATVAKPRR